MATRFQTKWREIAEKRSLTVESPFVVAVAGGEIVVPILLRDFGAPQGMLLVTEYDLIAPYIDELVSLGFGYSCLSEPTVGSDNTNDDALIEMLADWGWSGMKAPPAWYGDRTN